MSDIVNSGNVLSGYIPEKFGDRLVHIDAAHPLAARLVAEYVAPRAQPVLRIVGGPYDGGIVDLNTCTLDYALGQLGGDYCLDDKGDETLIAFVAPLDEKQSDPVLDSLPPAIVVPTVDALPGTAPEGTTAAVVGEQQQTPTATPMKTAEQSTQHETPAPATRAGSKRGR